MSLAAEATVPVSDVDPFCDAFLSDPYPFHESLREAGPVVRLERYGAWAMARHAQVFSALGDWRRFSSAAGVGIDDFRKGKPWRPPSILLEVDPPLHTKTRSVMGRVMSVAAVRQLRERFRSEAERLADALVERGSFDAIADLAEPFPLKVFGDAVGLPAQGRENLLPYSNMVFNSFGPQNALFHQSIANARPVLDWIFSMCRREALGADGFGAQIFAACDAGEIDAEEAAILVRALLTAGLDTTVNGLGNALYAFAAYPNEWRRYREQAGLRKSGFDEVIRWESPVQTFFRTTTRPIEIEGTRIGEGEKVLLFFGAANRDPRRWEKPDQLDIRRNATGHVAFGTGIHGCVGQTIARLEADVVLAAFADRVETFELADAPRRRLNNTLRGFASLPLRVRRLH
jgi:cytochrome P450